MRSGLQFARSTQAARAIGGELDTVAFDLQVLRKAEREILVVFDDENPRERRRRHVNSPRCNSIVAPRAARRPAGKARTTENIGNI